MRGERRVKRPNVTVVTGAGAGIGFAISLRQARAGDQVWALVRSPESGHELSDMASRENLPIEVRVADVTSDTSVAKAFEEILRSSGQVDRLVCNAGVFLGSTFESTTLDEFAGVFDVNYFGVLRTIKEVLPGMRERGEGTILALSSQSSEFILPTWAAYSGSKRALEATLEALAVEVGMYGIRIALVQPGSTRTTMRDKILPRENHESYSPILGRHHTVIMADREQGMEPDQVAQAVEGVLSMEHPPWRTRVGADAHRNTAMRELPGDDSWICLFQIPDDEEFFRDWSALRTQVDESGVGR